MNRKNTTLILIVSLLNITPLYSQWVRTPAPQALVNRLVPDSTSILAAYNGSTPLTGPYRSTDNGSSWISMSNGLTGGELVVSDFAVIDSGIMVGTGQGVWLSTDLGQSWSARNSGLPSVSFRSVGAMAVLGYHVYINIATSSGGFLSTNRGLSWVAKAGAGGDPGNPILVHNSAMYATGYVEVRKSTNEGSSFTSVSGGLPSILYGTQVIAINDTLYLSTNENGVFRSANDGVSWEPINNGLTGTATYCSAIAGDASILLLGTYFDGAFISTNRGASWVPVNEGLLSTHITCLYIRPPYAFAGTDPSGGSGGIWRRLLSDFVTSIDDQQTSPSTFSLEQNYPNPFNPTTHIRFRIADFGFVSLKVSDILGREVRTVVNENLQPGSYEKAFDAAGLSSGVYLYRLEAGHLTQTRRLILLR